MRHDSRLEPRVYINSEGQKRTVYFLDGIECKVQELTSPIAQQFGGYSRIYEDLLDAQRSLKAAFAVADSASHPDDPRASVGADTFVLSDAMQAVTPLWHSAIVMYSKGFTQAEGRRVKLERANLAEHFRLAHDKVLAWRHSLIAHAGHTPHERARIYAVFHPLDATKVQVHADLHRTDFADDRTDAVPFTHLIEHAVDVVNAKIDRLRARIIQDIEPP